MEIIIASANENKRREFAEIFLEDRVILPSDLGVSFEVEEAGSSFIENALQKAEALYQKVERPVLADDSGLSIDALHGAPGIKSARYGAEEAGRMLTHAEKNALILKKLSGIKERSAHFTTALALYLSPWRIYVIEESVEGEISKEMRGEGGFGYDPIFVVKGYDKTYAELGENMKDRISHRAKAVAKMKLLLREIEKC